MKLKEFTIEGLKNLGNYENLKLSVTAQLQDGDDASKQIDDLSTYVNYKLNYETRKKSYDEYKKLLDDVVGNDLDEKQEAKLQKFIDKFDALEAEIAEMKFVNVE